MKELSIEQKARTYDEALERARECLQDGTITTIARAYIWEIFPELKGSKDERIRKGITSILEHYKESGEIVCLYPFVSIDEALIWLKNQDKQEHIDKPKFNIDDWIVGNDGIFKITQYEDEYGYELTDTNGCVVHFVSPDYVESNFHLWTIADVKDGNVLWHSDTASNGIFIFKEIRHDGKVLCYCDYDSEDHFCTGEYHTCCWSDDKYIKPATKEQRDILFTKMEEAGYEWNAEKKNLLKV